MSSSWGLEDNGEASLQLAVSTAQPLCHAHSRPPHNSASLDEHSNPGATEAVAAFAYLIGSSLVGERQNFTNAATLHVSSQQGATQRPTSPTAKLAAVQRLLRMGIHADKIVAALTAAGGS